MSTAEFAVAQEIDHEQTFSWWVKRVLKIVIGTLPMSESGRPDT